MEKVILYKPELETMDREALLSCQLDLFRKQMAYVYERSPRGEMHRLSAL